MEDVRDYYIYFAKRETARTGVTYWMVMSKGPNGKKNLNMKVRHLMIMVPSMTYEDIEEKSATKYYIKATGRLVDLGDGNYKIIEG